MNKAIGLLPALALVLTLAACGADAAGTLPDGVTYVNHGSEYLPVSYVVGGEQQLAGYEGEWHEWKDAVNELVKDAPAAQALNQTDNSGMYLDAPPQYADDYRSDIFSRIAATGSRELFPVKVRYRRFAAGDQPDRADWVDHFGAKLRAVSTETPLLFTEAWFFDWDGDGTEETALVNAGNILRNEGDEQAATPANPPPSDNTAYYEMSALFVNGREPVMIGNGDFLCGAPAKEPVDDPDHISVSYLPPADGSEGVFYENPYSLVQFDTDGSLMNCPVYTVGETVDNSSAMVLVCDIDGDGAAELLTHRPIIYAPVVVYKLIDGAAVEVFRLGTDA